MSGHAHRHAVRIKKSRMTGYSYDGPFDETAMEKLLGQAFAGGVIAEFDTGRGGLVWFNGPPGAPLRELRAAVLALIAKGDPA